MKPTNADMPAAAAELTDADLRRLGEHALDAMMAAFRADGETPVLAAADGAGIRDLLAEPLPEDGVSPSAIMADWQEKILPYCRRNGHPRFFGYVCASVDPIGVFADGMASALNQAVTAWRSAPAAAEIERLVLRWLDALMGFAGGGGGLLVSGGSSANFHALACAVQRAEHGAGRARAPRHRQTIYMSREAHVSMRKAARLLGITHEHIRLIAVDDGRQIRLDLLEACMRDDVARGLCPAAVCASAGTANAGTIDPLEAIADLCAAVGAELQGGPLWFHIDGAYGAPAVMTEAYAWMARAFSRADSLSLDPHKWLFAPIDVGCLLLRDESIAKAAFCWDSEYTKVTETDPIEQYAFFDHGLEMTRRFRGLKVWSILKARGASGLREAITRNIALRAHLDARIASEPRLEHLSSDLSISCFRYRPEGVRTVDETNASNRRILEVIVDEGHAFMSPTTLDGRYALRICIVNFRTRERDVDFLLDEVLRIGAQVGGLRPA